MYMYIYIYHGNEARYKVTQDSRVTGNLPTMRKKGGHGTIKDVEDHDVPASPGAGGGAVRLQSRLNGVGICMGEVFFLRFVSTKSVTS